MPDVSVIVVTLKPPDDIECLKQLQADDFDDYEVIIRDDKGISEARNAGIQEACADKIVFLDDDAIPQPGYLRRASNLLEQHAIVAGRVIDPRDHYLARMGENRGYDQGDEPGMVNTVVGCNMAFRREVFETCGLFDETIQFGHDETLFIERASTDYDVFYDPALSVEHKFGATPGEWWRKQLQYGVTDVYAAQQRDENVFTDIYDILPISRGRSVEEVMVKSIGKSLRNLSRIRALITNPWSHDRDC